jgi:hypothetical protein
MVCCARVMAAGLREVLSFRPAEEERGAVVAALGPSIGRTEGRWRMFRSDQDASRGRRIEEKVVAQVEFGKHKDRSLFLTCH